MKTAAICICNFNKKELVLSCLSAVLEQTMRDFDIYICDNGSTDGSAAALQAKIKEYEEQEKEIRISLLVNEDNLGGSGGFNTAMRAALAAEEGYRYLMCVDNDCLLDEKVLSILSSFLNEHEDTGIAAAKIYHLEQPDIVQNYGQKIDYASFSTEPLYYGRTEDGSMPPVVYSDAVPACALLIRTSLCREVGLLPEENFLYWDDTRWCQRVKKAGYKIASVGSAMALHSMGARREDISTFPTYYAYRNWIAFFMEYSPAERLYDLAETFLIRIYLEIAACYDGNRFARARTIMAAYEDAIHGVWGKAKEGIISPVEKDGTLITYEGIGDLPEEKKEGLNLFVYAHLPYFMQQMEEIRGNM
ncbi:MAG: glycosyltransferase family 2 protein [Lachnospiraceae bacterium]|nr:glycosyltransferase family 2 protein [Lachnospiraceae bacterium]